MRQRKQREVKSDQCIESAGDNRGKGGGEIHRSVYIKYAECILLEIDPTIPQHPNTILLLKEWYCG